MSRSGWIVLGVLALVFVGGFWGAKRMGVFRTPEDLQEAAQALDAGVATEAPVDAIDGGVADARSVEEGDHSLALSGHASIALRDFAMNDQEGREVLRVQRMRGSFDVTALRQGIYRMSQASAQGVEVDLYRDRTGGVSLTHALSQTPDPARTGLHLPPKQRTKEDPWLLEIGPVQIADATLTIGFTDKPVQFYVDHAIVRVRRRADDEGPIIFIEDVHGKMTKPKPLPNPVRIAYASGLVKLVGEPLVDLTARTCIGRDELRAHALVPARKEAVTMTVDSQGLLGALGRMGLKIASRRDSEKMHYVHAPVKIEGGPGCKAHHAGSDDEKTGDTDQASEPEGRRERRRDHRRERRAE